jgi:hypothetical protein
LPGLTGKDLWLVDQKRPFRKEGGLDASSARECRLLPSAIWGCCCGHLRKVECGSKLPSPLKNVAVTVLEKGEGFEEVLGIRGIGCCSIIYTTYSSLRYRQTRPWLAVMLPEDLNGGRPAFGVHDSELEFSLQCDQSASAGGPLRAVFIDRVKSFDLIRSEISIPFAVALGLDPCIGRVIEALYSGMKWLKRIWQHL